ALNLPGKSAIVGALDASSITRDPSARDGNEINSRQYFIGPRHRLPGSAAVRRSKHRAVHQTNVSHREAVAPVDHIHTEEIQLANVPGCDPACCLRFRMRRWSAPAREQTRRGEDQQKPLTSR